MSPITTASAKNKGRKFQQAVVRKILEVFPELKEDDVLSRSMGAGGTDLALSPKGQRLIKTSFECKATREKPGRAAYEQAVYGAYPATTPVVVWKPHRCGPDKAMVMLSLDDYLQLVRKADATK